MLCTYNTRTVSTKADLHDVLEAARRVDYYVVALQEIKSKKTDVTQLSDGTLIIRGEKASFRTLETPDLSSTHLMPILSIPTRSYHFLLMTRNLMLFMGIWRKSSAKRSPSTKLSLVTSSKIGMSEKRSTGSGDLDQDSGMRMGTVSLAAARLFHGKLSSRRKNTGAGHELPNGTTYAEIDHILVNRRRKNTLDMSYPTVQLMRRSTTFSSTEGGAYWTSQSYHSPAVVRITASFEQKCDSAESLSEKGLSPCWKEKRIRRPLTTCDCPIEEDPTKDYDLFLEAKGLW
ncbi:unnamed protein product [Strongylus vulgaris]|uniref:Endonuclease/exonuclease/phosphatase domain-containing protein n=1 Tax=Strongylus vulgaris TaxID=40348 RepID=A0A3P7JLW5_STRVU|nr:unnamed protein product [Strongylus vulgaris]